LAAKIEKDVDGRWREEREHQVSKVGSTIQALKIRLAGKDKLKPSPRRASGGPTLDRVRTKGGVTVCCSGESIEKRIANLEKCAIKSELRDIPPECAAYGAAGFGG
jgi:hypothetical protein